MDNVLKWDTYSATSGSKMVDCASTAARSVGSGNLNPLVYDHHAELHKPYAAL